MRSFKSGLFILFALMAAAPFSACAQNGFYLKPGDRVVFYGDSITDQRLYTTFVETFVVTRFPKLPVTFVHSGWGGDRVTGGGGGPVDLRLDRDVIAYKPTVMTIMLAMNDASYRPFDQAIFDTYRNGYRHIVDKMKGAIPSLRMTLIQPSPFDDVTRPPGFPGGYNAVLVRYGEFVKEIAGEHKVDVADLNTSVVAALRRARELDEAGSAKIIQDRVHPGPGGQLIMAEALLKAWNAPSLVSTVEIEVLGNGSVKASNTRVADFNRTAGTIHWVQTDNSLPMPMDLKDAQLALAVRASDVLDALNRETLKVTGLSASKYLLKIDSQDVGSFTKEQLVAGINLATLTTPMSKQAADVHALTLRHNNVHFMRWRTVQVPYRDEKGPGMDRALAGLDALEADIIQKQRAAARPMPHRYELIAQ